MKRGAFLWLMILTIVFMLGCSKTQEATSENEDVLTNEVEAPTDIVEDLEEVNQDRAGNEALETPVEVDEEEIETDIDSDDTPIIFEQKLINTNFDIYALNLEDISKGILTTLEFHVGSLFSDIFELWGNPRDSDYFGGGRYYLYSSEQYDILFFDPEVDTHVKHIHIFPRFEVNLDDIQEVLGEPNDVGGDVEYEGLALWNYRFDAFTFYVFVETGDQGNKVQEIFLKSER